MRLRRHIRRQTVLIEGIDRLNRWMIIIQPKRKWAMKVKVLIGVACLAAFAMPVAVQAQGVPGGAAHGFNEGNRIAGPVGAVVGTAVGGVIGGVEGVLGINQRYYAEYPDHPHYRSHLHHYRRVHHRHHD